MLNLCNIDISFSVYNHQPSSFVCFDCPLITSHEYYIAPIMLITWLYDLFKRCFIPRNVFSIIVRIFVPPPTAIVEDEAAAMIWEKENVKQMADQIVLSDWEVRLRSAIIIGIFQLTNERLDFYWTHNCRPKSLYACRGRGHVSLSKPQ